MRCSDSFHSADNCPERNRQRTPNPYECLCGYPGSSASDLDQHIEAASRVDDGEDHGYAN